MNERRIKIPFQKGAMLVREMLTTKGIEAELGITCSWLYNTKRFCNVKPGHVDAMNCAMWGIADKLAEVHIEYSEDRQAVIDQIKLHLKPVKLKYIYEKHLGHDTQWWSFRTAKLYGNGYGYSFTEDDVLRINLAIEDIVARLRRIELVPDDID